MISEKDAILTQASLQCAEAMAEDQIVTDHITEDGHIASDDKHIAEPSRPAKASAAAEWNKYEFGDVMAEYLRTGTRASWLLSEDRKSCISRMPPCELKRRRRFPSEDLAESETVPLSKGEIVMLPVIQNAQPALVEEPLHEAEQIVDAAVVEKPLHEAEHIADAAVVEEPFGAAEHIADAAVVEEPCIADAAMVEEPLHEAEHIADAAVLEERLQTVKCTNMQYIRAMNEYLRTDTRASWLVSVVRKDCIMRMPGHELKRRRFERHTAALSVLLP